MVACMRQGIRDQLTCSQRVEGIGPDNSTFSNFIRICNANNLKTNFETECEAKTLNENRTIEILDQLIQDTIEDCGAVPRGMIDFD